MEIYMVFDKNGNAEIKGNESNENSRLAPYMPNMRKYFVQWLDYATKNGEKTRGELLYEIHNKHCEDMAWDEDMLFDLSKSKDFGSYFINAGYSEYLMEHDQRYNGKRWGWYWEDCTDCNYRYVLYNDEELETMVLSELESIAESVIAFPHEYPVALYEAIMWPIINSLGLVEGFELS